MVMIFVRMCTSMLMVMLWMLRQKAQTLHAAALTSLQRSWPEPQQTRNPKPRKHQDFLYQHASKNRSPSLRIRDKSRLSTATCRPSSLAGLEQSLDNRLQCVKAANPAFQLGLAKRSCPCFPPTTNTAEENNIRNVGVNPYNAQDPLINKHGAQWGSKCIVSFPLSCHVHCQASTVLCAIGPDFAVSSAKASCHLRARAKTVRVHLPALISSAQGGNKVLVLFIGTGRSWPEALPCGQPVRDGGKRQRPPRKVIHTKSSGKHTISSSSTPPRTPQQK